MESVPPSLDIEANCFHGARALKARSRLDASLFLARSPLMLIVLNAREFPSYAAISKSQISARDGDAIVAFCARAFYLHFVSLATSLSLSMVLGVVCGAY